MGDNNVNKNIILTISLLISNRPDTVEKCLKSLENLRQAVPSELILVDTGCGEQVREMIEKYTDHIIDFEWCNDFSKARNAGLQKARGEWFLYLDDDEWFEDTKEIEEFFISGEYKNYSMANYKQRNYNNLSGTVYSDSNVGRMTRIETDTQFKYSIHEVLPYVPGAKKMFNTYVHHYGYIFKSKQEHYKHSQRNLVPLLKEIEKNPYDLHHHIQIAQEYNGINEWYKSIEISLKGIEDFNPEKTSRLYINALRVNIVECYFKLYQYDKALEYARKFLKCKFLGLVCHAKLCYLLSKIHYELENYNEILPLIEIYREHYLEQLEENDIYTIQKTIFLNDTFNDTIVASALCIGVQTAIQLKEKEKAYHFFSLLDFKKNVLMIEQKLLESVCQGLLTQKDEVYIEMLNQLLDRKELVIPIVRYLEEQRKKDENILFEAGHHWEKINLDNWYFDYLKLRTTEDSSRRKELFEKVWKKTNSVLMRSMELGLWNIAEENLIDMYKIITSIPYYKWKQASLTTCIRMNCTELNKLNTKICSADKKESIYPHFLFWNVCFTERNIREIEKKKELKADTLFQHYAEQIEEFYNIFYKDEVMKQYPEFMPANFQVALCIKKVQEYMSLSDYKSAVMQLKTIRELCPDFSQAVKQYLQIVDDVIKQKEKEETEVKNEMANLVTALKSKIKFLIEQNNAVQALQIIQQLETFVGEDEELSLLKEQILNN